MFITSETTVQLLTGVDIQLVYYHVEKTGLPLWQQPVIGEVTGLVDVSVVVCILGLNGVRGQ